MGNELLKISHLKKAFGEEWASTSIMFISIEESSHMKMHVMMLQVGMNIGTMVRTMAIIN